MTWEGPGLIRLGIIDDHPVYRLGLLRTFEREEDLEVLWELPGVKELEPMLKRLPVDVLLMDLNLGPEEDALAAATMIRERYASVRIIFISASLDWEAVTAARAAGANGYLPKDLSIADMVATIRGLASPNFGRSTFRDLVNNRTSGQHVPLLTSSGLTRREQQVLAELRRGHTNKEIARRFGISLPTVNKHVQQVLKKLHVRTRAQAVAMVTADSAGRSYRVVDGRG